MRGIRMVPRTNQRVFFWLVGILTVPLIAAPQDESLLDARATQVLREMSDLLAATPSYAFRTEQTADEVLESGLKVQFAASQALALHKPNRAVGRRDGDLLSASFWYDGETATILDERHHRYVQIDVSDRIDAVLESLAFDYDIVMPLEDFVSEDVYTALAGDAEYATYLGIHRVGERRCHHVALANAWLEWQLWVDAENEPLPCKLLINYMDEPGEPQFTAVFHSWNLKPELSDDLFRFEPPEDAERMEARAFERAVGAEPGEAKR